MIDKILNPNTKVGDIFPNDVTQAKNIYRDLCKKYHPDTDSGDSELFDLVQTSYQFLNTHYNY